MRKIIACISLTFAFNAIAADGRATLPTQDHQLGGIVARFLQSSYSLEILTNRDCSKYAQRQHSAKEDYVDVLTRIPPLLKMEPANFKRDMEEAASERRKYAEAEVAKLGRTIRETGAKEEFRCGMLLGMASMTYLQARAVWAGFNNLEMPMWQQP